VVENSLWFFDSLYKLFSLCLYCLLLIAAFLPKSKYFPFILACLLPTSHKELYKFKTLSIVALNITTIEQPLVPFVCFLVRH
jgi:hypothetical protein